MLTQKIIDYAAEMVPAYLTCAAWASGEDGYQDFEFSDMAKEEARIDCLYFAKLAYPWLGDVDAGKAGHDLFLSRNGHGAGFFDREFKYADVLQELAGRMHSSELYVGDDGELYFDIG